MGGSIMASIINASTSGAGGVITTADASGELQIQSAGSTVATVTGSGVAVTGALSSSGAASVVGNLSFNSGYGSAAVAYGCRAWVNFNGTGTVAIRASGNVTSITDNGTGDYTVNFTTAMPDANYSATMTAGEGGTGTPDNYLARPASANPTTSALRMRVSNTAALVDALYVFVAVFR
jgi:hypothetical protein